MAKSRSDIELVITAEDKAKATLEDFNKLVEELAKAQKGFAASMSGTGESADELKKKIAQLNQVQTQLNTRSKAIGAYQEQAAALRKVSSEYFKFKDALTRTKEEMRQTATPSKELKAIHTEQARKVAALKKEYDRLFTHVKKTRGALKEHKIEVKSLKIEEEKLAQTQRNVTVAINSQTAALEKVSGSSRKAGKNIRKMGEDSRRSLSFFQRLRGEALALTATFGGLYAAGRGIQAVFEISRKIEAAKARLSVAFEGDAGKVADELARVRKEADRLGVNFETLVEEYTKFIPSAKRTGLTLNESRHIFDAITESAVVNRASMEDLGGIYKAVTQIISKGQVQAEELRGQLGDRLVGAVIDYANALNVSTAELNKMLEQGEVTASSLIEFATELKEVYGESLDSAIKQPVSQLARLQNAVTDIKLELANSGFVNELGVAMAAIAKELKDPSTQAGARSLGRALGEVVKIIVKIIQNFDVVIELVKVFIALKVATKFAAIGNAALTGAVGVETFGKALSFLTKRGAIMGGVITGIAAMVYWLAELALGAKSSKEELADFGEEVDRLTSRAGDAKESSLNEKLKIADDRIAGLYRALSTPEARIRRAQNKGVEPDSDDTLEVLLLSREIEEWSKQRSRLRRELEKIAETREKGLEENAEVQGRFVGRLGAQYRKAFNTLTEQFVKINEKAAKTEAKTLEDRLKAIDLSYQDMYAKIDEVEEQLRIRLAKLIDVRDNRVLSDQVRSLVEADIANMQSMLSDLASGREVVGKGLLEERQAAIELFNKKRITEELKISDFITTTQKEAAKQEGANLEKRLRFIDQQIDERIAKIQLLETASPELKQGGVDTLNELREELKVQAEFAVLQEQINELLEIQSSQVELIKLSYNDIWEKQAAIKEVNDEINPQVEQMAQAALKMAIAMGDPRAIANMKLILANIQRMNKELGAGVVAIHRMFSQGLTRAISDTVSGVKSAGEAFRQFAADFLKRLAEMIIQQQIFNALQALANSTGYGGAVGLVGGAISHAGGIVGQPGPSRQVPAYAFAGAPRFHGGGIPGIKSNEVPTILERGEEVLTADDPRHAGNGGGGAAPVNIVNSFDTESVVSQGIATPAGERAILNVIRANRNTIKGL